MSSSNTKVFEEVYFLLLIMCTVLLYLSLIKITNILVFKIQIFKCDTYKTVVALTIKLLS